jgi:hypothetical protein
MVIWSPGIARKRGASVSFFLPITYFSSVMPMYVDNELVQKARTADLYSFLIEKHPGLFRKEGISIRMIGNEAISVRRGYFGYRNFATGDTGNGIDLLMKYLGYSFQEAVTALSACPVAEIIPSPGRGRCMVETHKTITLRCRIRGCLRSLSTGDCRRRS